MAKRTKISELGLVPLHNFGVVSQKHKIFRCGQPLDSRQYIWIKEVLGVQTIVNLRAESQHDHKWAEKYDMKVYDIPVLDHTPPTFSQADEFVQFIRNNVLMEPQNGIHQVLLHCEHGHGRTSTFCVLARLALGDTLKTALSEEAKKFHYAFNHYVQTQFLEDYYKVIDR